MIFYWLNSAMASYSTQITFSLLTLAYTALYDMIPTCFSYLILHHSLHPLSHIYITFWAHWPSHSQLYT